MGLTPEETAALEELQRKAQEPDDSEDFEVEIYNPFGAGARVPYSKGRAYLQREFGIDLDPDPGKGNDDGSDPTDNSGKAGGKAPKAGGAAKGGKQQDGKGTEGQAPEGTFWTRGSRSRAT